MRHYWRRKNKARNERSSTESKDLSETQARQSTDGQEQKEDVKEPFTEPHSELSLVSQAASGVPLSPAPASSIVGSRQASPLAEDEYNIDSGSQSSDSQPLDSEAAQVKQLSTFSPNSNNVITNTHKELQLRLSLGEVSTMS